MYLNNYGSRLDLLIDWLIETVPAGSKILDIGASDSQYCPEIRRIADHSSYVAGVDADRAKLADNPYMQERYFNTLEEADIPAGTFDCAYALYAVEHVKNGSAFLKSVARVLRPGGWFFFITPNGNHYFPLLASMFSALGVDGFILQLIRGKELVDSYHCPTYYRLNRAGTVVKTATESGFTSVQFRYSEKTGEFAGYFPKMTKWIPNAWEKMVEATGKERLLGNLMCRMQKV